MHFRPEQVLLEKAIGVLVRKAPLVAVHDFFQRQRDSASPDKPTLARITPGPFRSHAQDPIDRQFHFPRLPKVQVLPGLDTDGLAPMITALPRGIWLAPGLGLTSLKQVAILSRGSSFPRSRILLANCRAESERNMRY
jgi:hypothetical protein